MSRTFPTTPLRVRGHLLVAARYLSPRVGVTRQVYQARLSPSSHSLSRKTGGCIAHSVKMAPSRQERRRAKRDAAKRPPAQAGASGAAAARADVHVNPVGDWTTQTADPNVLFYALGAQILAQRANAGDMEAQFSAGCQLMWEAEGGPGCRAGTFSLGAAGRSPKADVGLHSSAQHIITSLTRLSCVNAVTQPRGP